MHALPFLERLHDVTQYRAYMEAGRAVKWRHVKSRLLVALIMVDQGEAQEALEYLSDPSPFVLRHRGQEPISRVRDYVRAQL